jgi:hypothetical protein
MEPSGCNRWQSVANGTVAKSAQTREAVAVGRDELPESFIGKEGVSGSSLEEGLKYLQIRSTNNNLCLFRHMLATYRRRVHAPHATRKHLLMTSERAPEAIALTASSCWQRHPG